MIPQGFADWAILLFPMMSGFVTSRFCKIGPNAGQEVKFRPPSAVFGIAWTILYLCLGYAAMLSFNENRLHIIPYAGLVFTLLLWIILYGCCRKKKMGIYVLLFSLVCVIVCMLTGSTNLPKYLLVPLLVWLLFALAMNATEVQLQD